MRRRRFMDYMARRDGRNPYGSRGGYVVSSRRDRARGMDYVYDRGDYRGGNYEYGSRRGDMAYSQQDMERGRRDYEYSGQYDMAGGNYGDMRGRYDYADNMRDMHYGGRQGNFQPVEAMGYFTGYYGGGRRDYGYDYAGDYGENLTKEEIDHWKSKLMKEVEEKDKQFFSKEHISQKAKSMGVSMDKFNEDELLLTALMMYTDYCKTLGTANMDIYIRLAKDWLEDKDVAVKGGEKLAVYHDCIVEGEDD